MPPSKRKPRRKEADRNETSEVDLPESSPTRPLTKKRKVKGGRTSPKLEDISRQTPFAEDSEDSRETSEAVSNSDLIDSVISYLQVSKDPVVATTEYANEKNQPETEKVSAYAKIAGRDWTYFVVDQVVNIGRPPDDGKAPGTVAASSPIADMKDMLPVHIDLGPSKIVSRHHASIFYDSEFPEGGGWHVRVNGRNGVRVNAHLLKRGASQLLRSGDIMEIAGTQMMFVTPGDKAVIDPYFVEKAKQLASGEDWSAAQHAHPDTSQRTNLPPGSLYSSTGIHQPLLPAPAGYFKRAVTPPADEKDGRHQRGVFDSKPSPIYNRGLVMESTQDIDYSKDASKDLKPPFSYATMIAQAIFSSEEEKLTLSNIYAWIADKYAFYRHSNSGWQNSIRHNLSLNKAFQKVPRRTDEPGKGMKWQIAPEFRQEYWKKQSRKGVPASSSAPTSPTAGVGRDVNPNFRGPNGQNLGYDTSMVSSFSAINTAPGPPSVRRDGQFHSFNSSQPLPSEAFTPDRSRPRQDTQTTVPDPELEDSPLPKHFARSTISGLPTYTLPTSSHLPHQSPSNPTLSSSYLDTPFHSNHNIITPAPLRQNPRLAPPSTLVAPSKFMPESSPAGPGGLFWKGLMGSTPAHGFPDISPVKPEPGDDGRGVMSSSPPPMDAGMHSPSKPSRSGAAPVPVKEEEARTNGVSEDLRNHDDDDGVGGFDLARGFQPIGSFHSSQRSHSGNAARAST